MPVDREPDPERVGQDRKAGRSERRQTGAERER